VLSWVVTALDIYVFFFVNMVTFGYNPAISSVLGIAYGTLMILIVIYTYKATKCDPTDPTVYKQREADRLG